MFCLHLINKLQSKILGEFRVLVTVKVCCLTFSCHLQTVAFKKKIPKFVIIDLLLLVNEVCVPLIMKKHMDYLFVDLFLFFLQF